ncbi:MAG: nitroreductase [Methanobacteriota archaeon]|nr:MAG: nitroreductase [Euryarchaeota archaeon]
MEVQEAVKASRSVSKYKPTPIPEDKVQAVVSAARMAPSAENLQPWKFVAVTDEDLKRRLSGACTNGKHLPDAPMIFIACARLDEAEATVGGYMNSYPVDVGMAMSYLTLAAISHGLGTAWVFSFNEEKVREALRIPADVAKVVAMTPLGIPESWEPPAGRKPPGELLSYNGYE